MTTIVSDTFTDTTSTSLDAHTPDVRPGSNMWYGFTTGDAFINAADQAEATGAFVGCYIQSGVSDGILSAVFANFSEAIDTRLQIVFRAADVDEWADHLKAFIYRSADGGFVSLGLEQNVADTGTVIWELDPGAVSAAGPHTMRVEFNGTSVSVYWNDVLQHGGPSTVSVHLTNTVVGLGFANGGDGTIDDFLLTDITASPADLFVTHNRRIRVR